MTQQPLNLDLEARRKGVRRTLWVTGTIAVAIFLYSILSMLKLS
jgi:hypothetical protein